MTQTTRSSFLKHITIVCMVGLLAGIAFLAAEIGIQERVLSADSDAAQYSRVVGKLAEVAIAVRHEELEAVLFLFSSSSELTSRDEMKNLDTAIADLDKRLLTTMKTFRDDVPSVDEEHDPFFQLQPARIVGFRTLVKGRKASIAEVHNFYGEYVSTAVRLIAHFASRSSKKGSGLAFASINCAVFAARSFDTHYHVDALNANLQSSITGITAMEQQWRSFFYQFNGGCIGAASDSLKDTETLITARLLNVFRNPMRSSVSASTPLTVSTNADAITTSDVLHNASLATITAVENDIDGEPQLHGDNIAKGQGIAIGAILCCAVALGVTVQRFIRALLNAKQDQSEEIMLQSLEQSYERMEKFVTDIHEMKVNKANVEDGKQTQALEREVYRLRDPSMQLMSFAHPGLAAMGEGTELGKEPVLARDGLINKHVTMIFIDVGSFHARPTSESVKTVPQQLQQVVKQIDDAVTANGGVVHEVSGSAIVCGWNLCASCHDPEALACQTALNLVSQLENHSATFSAVSGDADVGFVGTETMKVFSVFSPIMQLGKLLLRLNKLHGTSMIIDNTTFSKLDAQAFRARPLEVVAIDNKSPSTAAFELLLWSRSHERDGRFVSWNEAFEEYKGGDPTRARQLFTTWATTYGTNVSVERMLEMLQESPPRTITYKSTDDMALEDELM